MASFNDIGPIWKQKVSEQTKNVSKKPNKASEDKKTKGESKSPKKEKKASEEA